MTVRAHVVCTDVLKWAEQYDGPAFMAMICDPPYELGFMGKNWDRSGIAFKPDTWKAIAQHLLPGAFGMAFASSRGWHRLACAIEDAGLVIHPSIFGWGFGSGFPKATRVDVVLEKQRHDDIRPVCRFLRAAMEQHSLTSTIIAEHFGFHSRMVDHWAARDTDTQPSVPTWEQWLQIKTMLHLSDDMDVEVWRLNGRKGQPGEMWYEREVIGQGNDKGRTQTFGGTVARPSLITAPATPLAKVWEQHRYGLQALKPALEPIIVFQKPYQGKPVQSITQTGAGALWIDGARLPSGQDYQETTRVNPHKFAEPSSYASAGSPELKEGFQPASGRWPANFCLQHHPECQRVGERQVKGNERQNCAGKVYDQAGDVYGYYAPKPYQTGKTDDSGHETVAAYQCHPECPVAALDAQAGVRESRPGRVKRSPGTHNVYGTYAGREDSPKHDDTGGTSRFFHTSDWSLEVAEQLGQANQVFYSAKASRTERDAGLEAMPLLKGGIKNDSGRGFSERDPYASIRVRNNHPTVKPLALTRWLATLLLPPAAYAPRRLLVPFCGVSSEIVGAMLAGWDEVLGIESDPSYVEIGAARIAYWTGWQPATAPETPLLRRDATPRTYDKKSKPKRDLTGGSQQQASLFAL